MRVRRRGGGARAGGRVLHAPTRALLKHAHHTPAHPARQPLVPAGPAPPARGGRRRSGGPASACASTWTSPAPRRRGGRRQLRRRPGPSAVRAAWCGMGSLLAGQDEPPPGWVSGQGTSAPLWRGRPAQHARCRPCRPLTPQSSFAPAMPRPQNHVAARLSLTWSWPPGHGVASARTTLRGVRANGARNVRWEVDATASRNAGVAQGAPIGPGNLTSSDGSKSGRHTSRT